MNETSGVGNLGSVISGLGLDRASLRQTAKNEPTQPASQVKTDLATVSPAANLLSAAAGGDDVRYEKVAALQKAIADGSYHVPSTVIADKLIESMLK